MNIHLTRQVRTYHTQRPRSPPWRPTTTGWLPRLPHLLPLHGLRQPRLALPLHLRWVCSWQSFHGNDNVTHSDCYVWKRQAKRAKVRSKTRACNRTIIAQFICQNETTKIWCWLWPGCLTWPASTCGWWHASSWSFSASLSSSLHPVWAKQARRWPAIPGSLIVGPIWYQPITGFVLLFLFLLLGPVSDFHYSESLIYNIQASGTPQRIHFLKAHDVSYPNLRRRVLQRQWQRQRQLQRQRRQENNWDTNSVI